MKIIAFIGILLFAALSPLLEAQAPAQAASPMPVLVELFTSEGCSDCPPADDLLAHMDRGQPVEGVQLIVLSEHVDYWNRLGWTDPFSSAFYSQRQNGYSQRFGLNSVYTPQMVVDGGAEFVGSDERRAQQVIREAAKREKVAVRISRVRTEGDALYFHVDADAIESKPAADLFAILADNQDSSNVKRGENGGRNLTHVAVARVFGRPQSLKRGSAYASELKFDLHGWDTKTLRLVVFIQERGQGRVLGATMKNLADGI